MRTSGAARLGAFLLFLLGACDSPPSECAVGEAGCPCTPAGECTDGSVCASGACERAREVVLRVDAPEARACEVLLVDGQSRVAGARFEGSTLGTLIREAPRTAVTFTSAGDAPLASDAVRLQVVGEGDAARVASGRCFDGSGQPIESSSIRVEG